MCEGVTTVLVFMKLQLRSNSMQGVACINAAVDQVLHQVLLQPVLQHVPDSLLPVLSIACLPSHS